MTSPPARRASAPAGPPRTGPGRPKDPGKRRAVFEAAKRLFLLHGFDGVSMDAIAAEAGVSKLTVYSHFRDKDALFAATIRAKCEEMLPPKLFQLPATGPLQRQLGSIARAFFALVTSPEAISMQRLMSAQPAGDGRLPQMFWEAGPQRLQQGFASFLQTQVDAGRLEIGDVARAASQFFCLLKGEPHARLSCGCTATLDRQQVDAHLRATVAMFLRAYAPSTPPRRRKR